MVISIIQINGIKTMRICYNIVVVTKQMIKEENDPSEICEYAYGIFETLHEQSSLPDFEFAQTVSKSHQTIFFIYEMMSKDSIEEYAILIFNEINNTKTKKWYQNETISALKSIGEKTLADIFIKIQKKYKGKEVPNEEITDLFKEYFFHRDILEKKLAQYIKKNLGDVVNKEYTEIIKKKEKNQPEDRLYKTEKMYNDEVQERFPWFKK